MRAELLLLGAIAVGCGGGNDASKGAAAPPSTEVAPPPPPPTSPVEEPKPATSQNAEAIKKLLTALVDAQMSRDAKRAAVLYADDAVLVAPSPSGRATLTGRDAIEKSYKEFFAGITNPRFGFSRVWIAGDTVITEWTSTFKHAGPLMGMPATDKLAGVIGCSVATVTPEGLIKSEHRYFDTITIAGQVGIVKSKVRGMSANVPSTWETFTAKEGDEQNVDKLKAVYAAVEKKSESEYLAAVDDKSPVHENYAHAETARGLEAAKQELADHAKAFPDMKIKVEAAWGVGEFAIAEITLEGTNRGPIGPMAATNKPIKLQTIDVARIKDGRVKHIWSWADGADMMRELGLMKPPAAPPPPKK